MRYVTAEGYKTRYNEDELLTQLGQEGKDGELVLDEEAFEELAEDAEAEVDSYLGVRYALPLPTVPASVRAAAYQVLRRRVVPDASGEDSPVQRGYEEARSWLQRIADGRASLGLAQEDREEAGGGPAVRGGAPQYTHSFFERYRR